MSPDEWFGDDSGPTDPEAIERERRRLEREAKRQGVDPADLAAPATDSEELFAEFDGPTDTRDVPSDTYVAPVPGADYERGDFLDEAPLEPDPAEPAAAGAGAPGSDVDPALAGRLARRRNRAAGGGGGRPPAPPRDTGFGKPPSGRLPGRVPRRGAPSRNLGRRGPLLIVGVIVAVVGVWFLFSLFQPFHGGSGSETVKVKIPKDSSVGDIGDILDDQGVIDSSMFFQLRATIDGKRSNLYPGTYNLKEGMSYSAALSALSVAPLKKTITLTIPEGYDRSQIAQTAEESGLPGDYTTDSVKYKGFNTAKYGAKNPSSLEGFLFPATYELPPKSTSETLVGQQLDAFNQNIGTVNLKYAKSKNLTVYDILIIASMIEGEVQVPKERKLVAAVIYNRLKQGIPLGIDATIRFESGNHTEALTQSELEKDTPYNTRINAGLPPGPIGNPGLASIEAAAHPADVNYLYYVVKPGTCGEHAFSSTDAQFQKDVQAYNDARDAAGGESPDSC